MEPKIWPRYIFILTIIILIWERRLWWFGLNWTGSGSCRILAFALAMITSFRATGEFSKTFPRHIKLLCHVFVTYWYVLSGYLLCELTFLISTYYWGTVTFLEQTSNIIRITKLHSSISASSFTGYPSNSDSWCIINILLVSPLQGSVRVYKISMKHIHKYLKSFFMFPTTRYLETRNNYYGSEVN
jgi:hypothetical protein